MAIRRSLSLALATLRSQPGKTVLTAAAIAVGVASVCFAVSFRQGVDNGLAAYFRSVGPNGDRDVTVYASRSTILGRGQKTTFRPADIEALRARLGDELVLSADFVYDVEAVSDSAGATVWLHGQEPQLAGALRNSPEVGSALDDEDERSLARVCILSHPAAVRLFGAANAVGKNLRLRNVPFRVKGVLPANQMMRQVGIDEEMIAFVPLSTATRRVFHLDEFGVIEAVVRRDHNLDAAVARLRTALRALKRTPPAASDPFAIVSQSSIRQVRQDEAATTAETTRAIGVIAVLLAAGIVATVTALAWNQRRVELGLKRALGATRTALILETLAEQGLLCALALAVGLASATALVLAVRVSAGGAPYSPFRFLGFNAAFFLLPLASTLGIAMLAAIVPVRRIVAVDPTRALS